MELWEKAVSFPVLPFYQQGKPLLKASSSLPLNIPLAQTEAQALLKSFLCKRNTTTIVGLD